MLTQLTNNLCRILKHNILRFDNGASFCYDCIIVVLGMLAARRCGMPRNAIQLHAEALQSMHVKTAHGVSTRGIKEQILSHFLAPGGAVGHHPRSGCR